MLTSNFNNHNQPQFLKPYNEYCLIASSSTYPSLIRRK